MQKKKKKRPTGPVTEEEVRLFLKWSDPTNLLSIEALAKAGDGDWVVGRKRIRVSTMRSAFARRTIPKKIIDSIT